MEPSCPSPKGILKHNKFVYHVRRSEIIVGWYTTRAIFKFIEMICSMLLFGVTFAVHPQLDFINEFLLNTVASSSVIISTVLYGGHFFENFATRWIEGGFNIFIIITTVICLTSCLNVEVKLTSEIEKALIFFLFFLPMLHLSDFICVTLCKMKTNCIYDCMENQRRQRNELINGKESNRRVTFNVEKINISRKVGFDQVSQSESESKKSDNTKSENTKSENTKSETTKSEEEKEK